MESKATNFIMEARKIKNSNWDEARGLYIKALRIYLEDKGNYRKQIAKLYFEMAMRAYEIEVWDHITNKKTILEDTSSAFNYIIESSMRII